LKEAEQFLSSLGHLEKDESSPSLQVQIENHEIKVEYHTSQTPQVVKKIEDKKEIQNTD